MTRRMWSRLRRTSRATSNIRRTGTVLALATLLSVPASVSGMVPGRGLTSNQSAATPAGSPVALPVNGADERCTTVLAIGDDGDACVAFVNALPESDPVDVSLAGVNGSIATDVNTGDYVDFVAVPADDTSTFTAIDSSAPDLVTGEGALSLDPGIAYVVILERAFDASTPSLTAVPLDLAPLGEETARVAFHHAISDAAQISVLGLNAPSDKEIQPGETTTPIDLPAGQLQVDVVPGNAQDVSLATLDLQLEADLSYLVILGGTTGDQTVAIIYAASPVAAQS